MLYDSGVRQECIMSPWLFNLYMDAMMKEVNADDLVLCGESEEDLRAMRGQFGEVYRRGLKVNVGKSKVMVLNGELGLECEVHIDRISLEHVSEFKYLGYVLGKSGTDRAEE